MRRVLADVATGLAFIVTMALAMAGIIALGSGCAMNARAESVQVVPIADVLRLLEARGAAPVEMVYPDDPGVWRFGMQEDGKVRWWGDLSQSFGHPYVERAPMLLKPLAWLGGVLQSTGEQVVRQPVETVLWTGAGFVAYDLTRGDDSEILQAVGLADDDEGSGRKEGSGAVGRDGNTGSQIDANITGDGNTVIIQVVQPGGSNTGGNQPVTAPGSGSYSDYQTGRKEGAE